MLPVVKRRLLAVVLVVAGMGLAAGLALVALGDNVMYFRSPTDILAAGSQARAVRLGGLVVVGSIKRQAEPHAVLFRVTDGQSEVAVTYGGIPPDLFRDGQGVVAEGRLGPDGIFVARRLLTKHDENYMPPEVARALQQRGALPAPMPALVPEVGP